MTNCFVRTLAATLAVVLLTTAAPTTAQDLPPGFDETFALASLNPLLMIEADAVVRLDVQRFEIDGPGRATLTARRVVTVLNADGREAGERFIHYDNRLLHLKKFSGLIRDAQGKVIRKLKNSDEEDYSYISGYSLYDDNRVRVARLYHNTYPYTVEFEYEVRYDGLINWPAWYPQQSRMPVVFGQFDIVAPAAMEIRYTVQGAALEPIVSQRGRRKTFRWQVEALPALELEPYGPAWSEQVVAVHTAPAVFEIEGAQGDLSSWQGFGQWYHDLSKGRDVLPPEARAEVHRLIEGLTDDREKARRLYAYLQEKTRYVSIQLGLGGWQPFDAAYVHERGYGDCKALTNYMQALLKEAGIPSFPALIRSGSQAAEVLADFPSNQFNHVVLSVPLEADTLWLEATSQTIPFGHLGTFTEDRYALLVKPDGGELVRTPRSRAADNQQIRHATIRLTAAGDATVEIDTRYTGNQQDHIRGALATRSGRERNEWLHEAIDLPNFEVVRADFSSVENRALSVTLPMMLKAMRYASRTGKRLFIPLNLLERWTAIPPPVEARTQPIEFFPYPFVDADTTRFELPAGFAIEHVPKPVEIETAFGRYEAKVVKEPDGMLTYCRRVAVTQATCPAEDYEAFRNFMHRIAQADREQVVLVAQ